MSSFLSAVGKKTLDFATKNSAKILALLASGGVIGTGIAAASAGPKALAIKNGLEDERKELKRRGMVTDDKVPKWTVIKAVAPVYLPTFIVGGLTIACILGADAIHTSQTATMAGLYAVSKDALKKYQAKVIETLGENKDRRVQDELAKDAIAAKPIRSSQVFITGKGNTLCFDKLSGRYFESDAEKIRQVRNDVNHRLFREMYISLNEFYDLLGLEPIDLGYDQGWQVGEPLDIFFSSQLTDDDRPCLVLGYHTTPRHDFRDTGILP